jgi:hypothetical protein
VTVRFWIALSLGAALSAPLSAQFAVTVQENGQATTVTNGASISLNAPAAGQTATGTIILTNLGTDTVNLTGAVVQGSNFTTTASSAMLKQFQSTTFTITYTAMSTAATSGDFLWPYTEVDSMGMTVSTGAVTFNLVGDAPNVAVSQVDTNGTFTTVPNGGTIQFPNTVVNSSSTLQIALSNSGSGPATINSITPGGAGFQLVGVPLLPLTVAAGDQLNLTARFTPTAAGAASGSLQITFASGTYSASFAGTGVTSFFTYQITQNGVTSPLSPGQTITFNNTGSATSAVIQIENAGTTTATLSNIAITGAGLSITSGPILPATLGAGQSNSITVTYTAIQTQASTGQLLIGTDIFPISVPGVPTLPSWQFTGASGLQQPFQQPEIGLSLGSPYPVALAGTLTISVAAASFGSDPAVQFSTGGVQVAFTIPANTLEAVFPGGSNQILLQTGTVAGTILITPSFTLGTAGGINVTPANPATLQLSVPTLPPALLTASVGGFNTTSLTVVVTGYSTTRDLGNLTVQFTPNSGFTVNATSFTLDLSAAANVFFLSGAATGGQFDIEIPFTFGTTGTATNLTASISAISVSVTNSVGASGTLQIAAP